MHDSVQRWSESIRGAGRDGNPRCTQDLCVGRSVAKPKITGRSARRAAGRRTASVGLPGRLVVVRAVRPRLQDPVESSGCFRIGADSDPNPKFRQFRALELADHTVAE